MESDCNNILHKRAHRKSHIRRPYINFHTRQRYPDYKTATSYLTRLATRFKRHTNTHAIADHRPQTISASCLRPAESNTPTKQTDTGPKKRTNSLPRKSPPEQIYWHTTSNTYKRKTLTFRNGKIGALTAKNYPSNDKTHAIPPSSCCPVLGHIVVPR
jgi:hypothetical protein